MDTKETILRAAEELFRQKGFNGVSMRDVAERAGIRVGNLTYYYPKKEQLVEAIFAQRRGTIYTPEALTSPAEFEAYFRHLLSVQRRTEFYFDSYSQLSQTSEVFRAIQTERLGALRALFLSGLRAMAGSGLIAPETREGEFADRVEMLLTVLMLRLPGAERMVSPPDWEETVLRRLMTLLGV